MSVSIASGVSATINSFSSALPSLVSPTTSPMVITNQKITYTPTFTGSGATAGVIYVTLQYVV